eukprot:TRINITY_DN95058_c0_g1_i1.p1 TRINITY_DN95058_c0_g1~~TRINITY_DN95058_c0_g1_i1.p1  ORF type:complete len:385 (-),score=55.77 TRINITY_DN95058_c0_g1_i1:55-1134(-)
MASANADRQKNPLESSCQCTLYLDARTYESSGLTMWRTLLLVSRLNRILLKPLGLLAVEPIFTDPMRILQTVADYLKVPAEASALDAKAAGTGAILSSSTAAQGCCRSNLRDCWKNPGSVASVWLLGGLCAHQANDLAAANEGPSKMSFVIFEQSQPAWQSMPVNKSQREQPQWEFPPSAQDAEHGFGVEPSNIRSSDEKYPVTIATYMNLQKTIQAAPSGFRNVFAALARSDGFLPVPPGKEMVNVSGRPLNVVVGTEYVVKKALDLDIVQKTFSRLLESSRKHYPDSIYKELITGLTDEHGRERPELSAVVKYGTFMADAIIVCLAARPSSVFKTSTFTRRLASVKIGGDVPLLSPS